MAKILVAEDDGFLASAYKVKLTKSGFDVTIVKDGIEALEQVAVFKPDLILLDLVMPKKDGFSALEELKKSQYASIPVVVTSNLGQKEDMERARNLGALDYLIKSDLSLDELVKKINEILKVRQ